MFEKFELFIDNNGNIQKPSVVDGLRWETWRAGSPSKLTFEVVRDEAANFTEGNPVVLKVNGENMFYGFVFSKRRNKQHIIKVTCYDQMRYLKNKDTLIYTNKTASDIIRIVQTRLRVDETGSEYGIQLGDIAETSFVIPCRDESNTSYLDMIYSALDFELVHAGNMFIFYDDFGRLTLRDLSEMKVDLIIDEETGENFNYTSSINDRTYNRIKLVRENEETGMRDIYVVQDGHNIDRWGILQYFGTLQEGESGYAKAAMLLDLFNNKTRKLQINNAFGDTRIRAGMMPIIDLHLGDIIVRNHMLVEKCSHKIFESEHWMDLTFRGGDIHG